MTYDIKSVLSAWALMVFTFFHQVVILIFKDKILMHIAQNTAYFAKGSLKPLVICFHGFPLAVPFSRLGNWLL
jgi:hypothetical protein